VTSRYDEFAEKARGTASYTFDRTVPRMAHAALLRSPHAHARIVRIDTRAATALPGVLTVLTGADLTDRHAFVGRMVLDRLVIAVDRAKYAGDIVAAVVAVDEATAARALDFISVTYDVLPSATSIDEALSEEMPAIAERHPNDQLPRFGAGVEAEFYPRKNVCYRHVFRSGGDIGPALASAHRVHEDRFTFSRMCHYHLEPLVVVCSATHEAIDLWTGTQVPFGLRAQIAAMFGYDPTRVRVHVDYVGGSYGAKIYTGIDLLAVVLSRAAGRPVRLCLSLAETMATQSQHAAVLTLRTAVDADGALIARDAHVMLDAGAYADSSPRVAQKLAYLIAGPYGWQATRTQVDCVLTNTVPANAFRGFGGPQAAWATESQVDMIARRMELDPLDFRLRNVVARGTPYLGVDRGIDVDAAAGLRAVANRIGYGRPAEPGIGRGVAIGVRIGGRTGLGATQAIVRVSGSGAVLVQCAVVELGQGGAAAMRAVAARTLGVETSAVRCAAIDTHAVPSDSGTMASSGTAFAGGAVAAAAAEARAKILGFAASRLGANPEELDFRDGTIVRGTETFQLQKLIVDAFDSGEFEFTGHGSVSKPLDEGTPFRSPSQFFEAGWVGAEVAVDCATGFVHLRKIVVASDSGFTLDAAACRGQNEGSGLMGIGQTLFEGLVYQDDVAKNAVPLRYRVPLAGDLPAVYESIVFEGGDGPGAFGSKGVGESGILAMHSAIANAVHDAVGVRITSLPLSPERVLEALDRRSEVREFAAR
jgi:CO/xanthine dehydrogenase Mo-binding subunit